ncbi:hypothetical protein ACFVUS_27900 [Nocardia sp. NPDC058058]|uniref:hypothetical protein n=1 Tax=Nocardia sp. NPDC058058 TaxID=3346317 RepID=UPI0036DC76DD
MPKLMLSNPFAEKTITVWLEPWGRDYWMRPGDVFIVEFEEGGDSEQDNGAPPFEISWLDNGITVAVLVESTVRDRSGVELDCGHQRPVDLDRQ